MTVSIFYLEPRLEKKTSTSMSINARICTEGWNFLQSNYPGET